MSLSAIPVDVMAEMGCTAKRTFLAAELIAGCIAMPISGRLHKRFR